MTALLLALTWPEVVAWLIAAGLGFLAGYLWTRWQPPKWPFTTCQPNKMAFEYMMEIWALAEVAPQAEQTTIRGMLLDCMKHTGFTPSPQNPSYSHCDCLIKALAAAQAAATHSNGGWDFVISELTHTN